MTRSLEHEELINDVRHVFFCLIASLDVKFEPLIGPHMIIETCIVNALHGWDLPIYADGYLFPCDDAGPVFLEVGRMPDGKWGHATCDGKPIRVLRIGFDRTAWFLNAQFTDFELAFLSVWQQYKQQRLEP